MFVEKLGRVDLTIDAFVELQNNVLSFKTSGLVALWKFHEEGIVCWLRTLAEC